MNERLLSVVIGILLFSGQILATSFDELPIYAEAFSGLGDDNNYIDSQIIDAEAFFPKKMQAEIISERASLRLRNVLAECVFMKKGAYGDHFKNDEVLNLIIDRFHDALISGYTSSEPRKFFRISDLHKSISTGLFGAPCVFAMQEGNQVLLLQASTTD